MSELTIIVGRLAKLGWLDRDDEDNFPMQTIVADISSFLQVGRV